MSRPKRHFKLGYCYHVTTRCNNREFKLTRHECRQVFLYALKKALNKFDFKLYALCIIRLRLGKRPLSKPLSCKERGLIFPLPL